MAKVKISITTISSIYLKHSKKKKKKKVHFGNSVAQGTLPLTLGHYTGKKKKKEKEIKRKTFSPVSNTALHNFTLPKQTIYK